MDNYAINAATALRLSDLGEREGVVRPSPPAFRFSWGAQIQGAARAGQYGTSLHGIPASDAGKYEAEAKELCELGFEAAVVADDIHPGMYQVVVRWENAGAKKADSRSHNEAIAQKVLTRLLTEGYSISPSIARSVRTALFKALEESEGTPNG